GSLADRSRLKPLTPEETARLVERLADAVSCAHEHGVVHRDLKTANVLLSHDGVPKITDFGLAKLISVDQGGTMRPAEATEPGTLIGTTSYMAPEQAEGRTGDIGPSADIYALGAILYDLLTGRPPFRGDTLLHTLIQVRHCDPVPPSQLHPK